MIPKMVCRHFHKMGDLQWQYNRELAALAGIDALPDRVEHLYQDVHRRRAVSLGSILLISISAKTFLDKFLLCSIIFWINFNPNTTHLSLSDYILWIYSILKP
jgi:hypothetical protein